MGEGLDQETVGCWSNLALPTRPENGNTHIVSSVSSVVFPVKWEVKPGGCQPELHGPIFSEKKNHWITNELSARVF